jgi:hypothetical protein
VEVKKMRLLLAYILCRRNTWKLFPEVLNQPIKEYRLTYNGYERIDAANVGHLKNINLSYTAGTANHLYGASPLRSAVRDLTTSNDGKQALLSMLQNMGARGILTGDGSVNITREQAQGLKEDYASQLPRHKQSGRRNYYAS